MTDSENGVVAYKVWIHVEGVNEDGDCVEGDEYYEPVCAVTVDTADEAMAIRDHLASLGEWYCDKLIRAVLSCTKCGKLLAHNEHMACAKCMKE